MRPAASSLRCTTRWLPALLVAAGVVTSPAHAATWRLEPIPASEGVGSLHELGFDEQGRGLLSWSGSLRGRVPENFDGLATRDPAGGWQRPPDLEGIDPASAAVHLHGAVNALLIAREPATGAGRRRLAAAEGLSEGGFGTFGVLDEFVERHVSDANSSGAAIVAWSVERSPFIRVAERDGAGRFQAPRDLAVGQIAAVSINARGDRVLAWRAGRRLAVRIRRAGGTWGPTERFGRMSSISRLRLSALIMRNGRVVVTWGSVGRRCGVSVRRGAGRWRTRTLQRRCGPTGAGGDGPPVLAIADGRGASYVAWTGRTRGGRRAVRLARVGGAVPSRRPLTISRERSAVLDDVAAGPARALAITYSAPRPTRARPYGFAAYAALRRRRGGFGRPDRLTPPDVLAARGSRVAFQPLTGEPIVALPFLIGRTAAVGAAVGPAAPAR